MRWNISRCSKFCICSSHSTVNQFIFYFSIYIHWFLYILGRYSMAIIIPIKYMKYTMTFLYSFPIITNGTLKGSHSGQKFFFNIEEKDFFFQIQWIDFKVLNKHILRILWVQFQIITIKQILQEVNQISFLVSQFM